MSQLGDGAAGIQEVQAAKHPTRYRTAPTRNVNSAKAEKPLETQTAANKYQICAIKPWVDHEVANVVLIHSTPI